MSLVKFSFFEPRYYLLCKVCVKIMSLKFLKLSQNKDAILNAAELLKSAKSSSDVPNINSALPNIGDRSINNSVFTDSLDNENFIKSFSGTQSLNELNQLEQAQYNLLFALADTNADSKLSINELNALDTTGDKNFSQDDINKIIDEINFLGVDTVDDLINSIDILLDNPDINGELDEKNAQQGTGDCYFLTSINSMSKTKTGSELIKNAISYNDDDNSYTVNFAGIDKSYTFSADEIKSADEKKHEGSSKGVTGSGSGWYSEGDDDMLLLEMAFEQFRLECAEGKFKNENWPKFVKYTGSYDGSEDVSPLNSGNMDQVLFLFTGKKAVSVSNGKLFWQKDDIHQKLDELQDLSQNNELVIYAAVKGSQGYTKDKNGDYYLNNDGKFIKINEDDNIDKNLKRYSFTGPGDNNGNISLDGINQDDGQKISITGNSNGGHAISITDITDDSVTIINPWNSDKEITVSRDQFEKYMYNLQYLNLSIK